MDDARTPALPDGYIESATENDPGPNPEMFRLGGFNRMIGLRYVARGEGWVKGILPLRPELLNKAGTAHGGLLSAIMDSVGTGSGCWCPYPGRIRQCVTLSLTANFVGVAKGEALHVTSRVKSSGRKVFSSEIEVHDDFGTLCAHGVGTFKYVKGTNDPYGVPIG